MEIEEKTIKKLYTEYNQMSDKYKKQEISNEDFLSISMTLLRTVSFIESYFKV